MQALYLSVSCLLQVIKCIYIFSSLPLYVFLIDKYLI